MKYNIHETYENAILVPCLSANISLQKTVVYTSEKQSIPLSLQRIHSPLICSPYKEPSTELNIEAIYGGNYINHYGHFILESLSRLWFAKENPHLPVVWNTKSKKKYLFQEKIIDLLEIKNEFIFLNEPTRIKKLHIPINLAQIYPSSFSEDYFKFLAVYESKETIKGKKIYISKTHVRGNKDVVKGTYANEYEIEEYVKQNGYKVLYPEELPLQVALDEFSSAEEILMIEGSAFYSFLFIKNLSAKIHLLPRVFEASYSICIYYMQKTDNKFYLDCKERTLKHSNKIPYNLLEVGINDLDEAIKLNKYKEVNLINISIEDAIIQKSSFDNIRIKSLDLMNTIKYEKSNEKQKILLKEAVNNFLIHDNSSYSLEFYNLYSSEFYELFIDYLNKHKFSQNLLKYTLKLLDNFRFTPETIKYYNTIISIYYNKISFYKQSDYYNKAFQYLKENKIDCNYLQTVDIYYSLASFCAFNGDISALDEILTKINNVPLEYRQDKITAHIDTLIYLKSHDFQNALTAMQAIINNSVESYFYLSYIYSMMNKFDFAEKYIKKAIEIDSENIKYKLYFIKLLIKTADYQQAKKMLEKYLKSSSNKVDFYILYACLCNIQENTKKANEYLKKANEIEHYDFSYEELKKELKKVDTQNINSESLINIKIESLPYSKFERTLMRIISSNKKKYLDYLENRKLFFTNSKNALIKLYRKII